MAWDIAPGTVRLRAELHNSFAGNRQAGIAALAKFPEILLFSTKAGKLFGYHDNEGWIDSSTYLYTGEGKTGDQKFSPGGGNAAIRDHASTGRSLRLFEEVDKTKTGGVIVRYVGEFYLDKENPYEMKDAPDAESPTEMRSVIVFRLRPTDSAIVPDVPAKAPQPGVIAIPIESHQAEAFISNAAIGETLSERREAALVKRYATHLQAQGHKVNRHQIRLTPGTASIFTDLYDATLSELIEAKGSASRNQVRLAIGQLFDYRRYIAHDRLGILLPSRPAGDLLDLMTELKISCIYETEPGRFEHTRDIA